MWMNGLEPTTPCMSSKCSNQLSYTHRTLHSIHDFFAIVNTKTESFLKKFSAAVIGAFAKTPQAFLPAELCLFGFSVTQGKVGVDHFERCVALRFDKEKCARRAVLECERDVVAQNRRGFDLVPRKAVRGKPALADQFVLGDCVARFAVAAHGIVHDHHDRGFLALRTKMLYRGFETLFFKLPDGLMAPGIVFLWESCACLDISAITTLQDIRRSAMYSGHSEPASMPMSCQTRKPDSVKKSLI